MRKNDLAIDSTLTSTQTASCQASNIDVNSLKVPYIAWEIEKKCNMHCQFCYSSSWNKERWGKNQTPPAPSVQFIINGLELLKKSNLHIKYINWSGGEPLLRHKDLLTIFKESNRQGFKNILSTNCMFTPLFNEEKPEQKFIKFLDEVNDYLDFISISWDADKECNNAMRLDGHYEDVQTFLNIFKEERYTFKLKVNTVVTKKNVNSINGILDILKDIPCIWKIVQFNPRECPVENRRDYEIAKYDFLELFDKINSRNNALPKASKCTIINRLYEGTNEPYCFLVINTKGEVLLPKGETHVPLANIFEKNCNPNNFKEQVSQRIHNELVDAQVYKTKPEEGRKLPLEVFTETNNTILNRSYLHCKFNEDEAKRKINKLQSIERRVLIGETGHSQEFCDAIKQENKENMEKEFCRLLCDYNKNSVDVATGYKTLKFFFEQEKVGKFFNQSWGVIGGTIPVFNYGNSKENSPRITPCVDRAPAGIHFPWCFDSFEKKREFFKKLFKGGIVKQSNQSVESDTFTTREFVEKFIVQRELPEDILNEAIDKTIKSKSTPNSILELIKEYLNDKQFQKHEDWITLSISSLILTICVELILKKLASTFKDKSVDPLHKIFQNPEEKEKCLSRLEKKLDIMMIPAEELISVSYEWFTQMSLNQSTDEWERIKSVWMSLTKHERVKGWQEYQKNNNNEKRKLQFNDSKRILPDFCLFWLYLFSPFIENEKSLNIPHVLFIEMQKLEKGKSGDSDKNTISSFAGVYFNDEVFQRFWNSQEEMWRGDSNDVNEIDFKSYIDHIANLIYPVAAYNVNLELNEEREEIAREHEAKKVEINSQRSLAHFIKNAMTGLSYTESKISQEIETLENISPKAKIYSHLQIAAFSLISLFQQLRQDDSIKPTNDTKNNDNSYLPDIGLLTVLRNIHLHIAISRGYLAKAISGLQSNEVNRYNVPIKKIQKSCNDTYNAYKEKTYSNIFTSIDNNYIQELEELLSKIPQHKPKFELLNTHQKEYSLHLTPNEFIHFYTSIVEILDNATKHRTFNVFAEMFEDNVNYILFITCTNTNENCLKVNEKRWDYQNLKEKLSETLPSDGFGMSVIRNSLKQIGLMYKVVKWNENSYVFDEDNKLYFWSLIMIPKKSSTIRTKEVQT